MEQETGSLWALGCETRLGLVGSGNRPIEEGFPVNSELRPVQVAVDAYSGDNAPDAMVAGALLALGRDAALSVTLVGPTGVLEDRLRSLGASPAIRSRVGCVDALGAVPEGGRPVKVLRQNASSSVAVAAQLVRDKRADAGVSVGNTGAALAAATLIIGLLPGVHRPMVGTVFPFAPSTFFGDLGPNVDVIPHHLVEFARLGVAYAQVAMGIPAPKVGLLSNGGEAGKGNHQVREAYPLLAAADFDFIGAVEAADVFAGAAHVVIADGYIGNLVLKFMESLSTWNHQRLVDAMRSLAQVPKAVRDLERELFQLGDVTRLGHTAPFLGIDGVFLPGHGRAAADDVAGLIAQAASQVRKNLVSRLNSAVNPIPTPESLDGR